jgi:hypothetical protein
VTPWGTRRRNVVATGLLVQYENRAYRIDLSSRVDTWRISIAHAIAAATRADTIYLLADVSGRSRWNDGSGECGAGTEGDLLWAKLVARRIVTIRTAPYLSCWRNIGTAAVDDRVYAIDSDSLWMDETFPLRHSEVRLRYYLRDPARGLEAFVDTARIDSLPRYPREALLAGTEGDVVIRIPVSRYMLLSEDSVALVHASDTTLSRAVREIVAGWMVGTFRDSVRRVQTIHFRFAIRHGPDCDVWRAKRPSVALPPPRRALWLPEKGGELTASVESCRP